MFEQLINLLYINANYAKLFFAPAQTGTGKNGEWRKQDIIVETDGQFPKNMYLGMGR